MLFNGLRNKDKSKFKAICGTTGTWDWITRKITRKRENVASLFVTTDY